VNEDEDPNSVISHWHWMDLFRYSVM